MSRKLTNEDIKERIFELVGDEYTKLDNNYINSGTKFKIKHNLCGFEYMVNWDKFKQGKRCPKCAGKYRYTDSEISELISEMTNGEYIKLSEYKDSRTKFKIRHEKCNFEYEVCWRNFQKGTRCPKCSGCYRYTDSEITKLVSEMTNGEYIKLSEYKNSKTKFRIRHNVCGCEYEVCWSAFQKGNRCPKCAGRYRYTDSEISELVAEMTDGEYTKLSEYKNAITKFKMRHNLCGYEYEVNWHNFQQGYRCPKCAILAIKNKLAFTNEDIVKAMYKLVGDEYTKLDDTYINAHTKFSIRHNKCGHEYMVSWDAFQRSGSRCPCCNQSKGEKFIEDYLTNKGISFTAQIRFDDCKYKRPLPFDFAILDDNKRVICLVEYNGIQHYESVSFFGGEETLKITQLRDQIKDDYCKKNGIPLLRIKYNEDIEEKLNLFINQEQRKVAN